jgi:hypothetical protein
MTATLWWITLQARRRTAGRSLRPGAAASTALLATAFVLLPGTVFAQCPDGQAPVMRFTAIFKRVEVFRDGEWYRAERGQELCLGDLVRTGPQGRARMQSTEDSFAAVSLGSSSQMRVEPLRLPSSPTSVIDLIRGTMRSLFKNWGSPRVWRVRHGGSMCGIRGSDVGSSYDPVSGTSEHLVLHGSMVCELEPGVSYPVEGGQMITLREGAEPVVSALDPERWRGLEEATSPTDPAVAGRGCGNLEGRWHWPAGTVCFGGDALGGYAEATGNPNVRFGTWRCTGESVAEVTWDGGRYVDTLVIGDGGLSATNQNGYRFESTKLSPEEGSQAGEVCDWREGTAVYAGGCVCTNADGVTYTAPASKCGR